MLSWGKWRSAKLSAPTIPTMTSRIMICSWSFWARWPSSVSVSISRRHKVCYSFRNEAEISNPQRRRLTRTPWMISSCSEKKILKKPVTRALSSAGTISAQLWIPSSPKHQTSVFSRKLQGHWPKRRSTTRELPKIYFFLSKTFSSSLRSYRADLLYRWRRCSTCRNSSFMAAIWFRVSQRF